MSQRIEYIDALRGFTMILVVMNHVVSFGYGEYSSLINALFVSFRMPLFFFISGYLAYKDHEDWTFSGWRHKMSKKVRIQIVPAIIFGLCYCCLVLDQSWTAFFEDLHKMGYWFTIVLLEIFFVFYTVSLLCNYIYTDKAKATNWKMIILVLIAFLLLFLKFPMKEVRELSVVGDYTCLHLTMQYFQFFVFGVVARKYSSFFHTVIKDKMSMTLIISLFIVLFVYRWKMIIPTIGAPQSLVSWIEKITAIINGYLGIIIVYCCFRKYRSTFSTQSYLGKSLQFIGKRTLDIYLLHFFLLPKLPMVGAFLTDYPNVVVEIFLSVSLSLLIILCCIIASNVLRTSDYLAHMLFGLKEPVTK